MLINYNKRKTMNKLLLPVLFTSLITGTVHATSDEFTVEQKTKIQQIASQYIIDNPEILVKASETLQKKQIEQQQNMTKEIIVKNMNELINDKNTPYIGPKNAKVNVIEFFDYQCGYCLKMSSVLNNLQIKNPSVKFIYKETPIFANRFEISQYAANMGNWVFTKKGNNAYREYNNGIFSLNKLSGKLTKEDVNTVAKNAGVDISQFKDSDNISHDFKLFSSLGFQGTPALIVMPSENITKDNIRIINGYDPEGLAGAIKEVQASL